MTTLTDPLDRMAARAPRAAAAPHNTLEDDYGLGDGLPRESGWDASLRIARLADYLLFGDPKGLDTCVRLLDQRLSGPLPLWVVTIEESLRRVMERRPQLGDAEQISLALEQVSRFAARRKVTL